MSTTTSMRAPNPLGPAAADHPRLIQYLALGFLYDHTRAEQVVDDHLAARRAWRREHGRRPLGRAGLADLLIEVVRGSLAHHGGAPLTLGLSSGYDSRALFWALRELGREPTVYTFGARGNIDFDLVPVVAERAGFKTRLFDSNSMSWNLRVLESHARTTSDLPISPRALVVSELDHDLPGRADLNGYLNGAVTGATRPESGYRDGRDAFLRRNDPFGLQRHLPPEVRTEFLEGGLAARHRRIRDYWRLDLGYRQAQRIRDSNGSTVMQVRPFADSRWVGYWLNRPSAELAHQSGWIAFIRELDPELFADLQDLDVPVNVHNSTRVRRLYGRGGGPPWVPLAEPGVAVQHHPKNHFGVRACYRNNSSFRATVDESIERLRTRGVITDEFIDHALDLFHGEERAGENLINGLVSADIALEVGRF